MHVIPTGKWEFSPVFPTVYKFCNDNSTQSSSSLVSLVMHLFFLNVNHLRFQSEASSQQGVNRKV